MSATLGIHDAPQVFKLARRVIIHWSANPPFHPAIKSTVKTKLRGPHTIADTGRAGVANHINEICHFTSH
jgi:hypothetical protein